MEIVKAKKQKVTAKKTKEPRVSSSPERAILLDMEQLQESIRKKAYELYIQRGAIPGHELEDWVMAEHFVLENINFIKHS